MARSLTAAQTAALLSPDRKTSVRVKVEDADGLMATIDNLAADRFFHSATIEFSADAPISRGTFTFLREAAGASLAPLIEGSELNRTAAGTYAPRINPVRRITMELAVQLPGEATEEADYIMVWDGLVDDLDWAGSKIIVNARDRLAILQDTIKRDVTKYGADDGSKNIDTVMQEILDDGFGAGVWPITVVGTPTFPVKEYDLGNVSYMEAIRALADLIGWNVHYKWDSSAGEFRLHLYEPDRDNTTPSWTFTTDDYFVVSRAAIGVQGIRNDWEVVYTDLDGEQQRLAADDDDSIEIYGTRFGRIDLQGGSINTEVQASAFLTAVLSDTKSPKALQELVAALHWPMELGDVHTYEGNGVHYDTDQTWAVFGFTHTITPTALRTSIRAAGKPSGGFSRWHRLESRSEASRTTPSVTDVTYARNASGELIVSVQTSGARSVRVAAGEERPTDAAIEEAQLQTLDADGTVEINLGASFTGQVVLGIIAYERLDGSGFSSDPSITSSFAVEYITAKGGTIGGWTIDEDEVRATGFSLSSSLRRLAIGAATAVLTGTGIFAGHVGDGTYDLRAGDPAGDYFHWDESESKLFISGEIEATSGSIGGWTIGQNALSSGSLTISSSAQQIRLGSATAPLTGDGIFMGLSAGEYQLRFGDPAGDYILWDGSTIVLNGELVGSGNLIDGAVITSKLDDEAVTAAKLLDGAVTSDKLGDGSVIADKIAAGAVEQSKVASSLWIPEVVGALPTLPSASYPNGALVVLSTNWKLYRNASGTWTAQVAAGDLSGTVDLGTQVSGTLTASFAAAGLINSNVTINADGTLSGAGGGQASLTNLPGTVAAGQIAAGAVTTVKLDALAVTAAKLAAGAVTTVKLDAGAVTADKLAANSVTAGKIEAGAVGADAIAARSISAQKLFIGSFDNLVLNGSFEQFEATSSQDGWRIIQGTGQSGMTAAIEDTDARTGNQCLRISTASSTIGAGTGTAGHLLYGDVSGQGDIAVAVGDVMYAEWWIKKAGSGTSSTVQCAWRWYTAAGNFLGISSSLTYTPTEEWQRCFTPQVAAPSGAFFGEPDLRIRGTAEEDLLVDDVYARRMVEGSIIVDGTLTARHIEVGSLTGNLLQADTITGDKIAARTIGTEHLFVGSFDNLVANPGFEQAGSDGLPAEWHLGTHASGEWSTNTTLARSGGSCLQYDATSQDNYAKLYAGANSWIEVAPGQSFYAEVWVRNVSGGTTNPGHIRLEYRDQNGTLVSGNSGNVPTATDEWQLSSVTATIPSGATRLDVVLQVVPNGNGGTILFDDVYIRRRLTGEVIVDGTLSAQHIESLSFSGKTAVFDTGSVGGWLMTAGTLHSTVGNMTLDSANETFLVGDASAPLTGIGVFIGDAGDGTYDLRVGNPSGHYLHWDHSEGTLTLNGNLAARSIDVQHLQIGSFDNLIRNPGWEQDATSMAPWREIVSQGTWTVSTGDPRSGSRCLTHNPAGMTGDARIENGDAGNRWEAAAGESFYFSLYYELSGANPGNPVEARIVFRDSAGSNVGEQVAQGTSQSTDYQLLEVTGTAPSGTAQVSFEIRIVNSGQSGIRKIDDCYARRMVDGTLVVGTLSANVVHTGKLRRGGIEFGPLHLQATEITTITGTSEQTLETFTIPGGAMGTFGGVRITAIFQTEGNNGTKTLRIRVDGQPIASCVVPATTGSPFIKIESYFIAEHTAIDQRCINFYHVNGSTTLGTMLAKTEKTGLIDTSSNMTVTVTGQKSSLVSGEHIRLESVIAELIAPGS